VKGVNWLSLWFTESVFQWEPINLHHSLLLNVNLITIISEFSEYPLMTSTLFIYHSSSSVGQVLFSLNKSKQLKTILFWLCENCQHKASRLNSYDFHYLNLVQRHCIKERKCFHPSKPCLLCLHALWLQCNWGITLAFVNACL